MSFGQPWYFYYPQPFPTWWYWGRKNYIIAPYWNDHDTRQSGSISYEVHQSGANSVSNQFLNIVSRFIEANKGVSFSGRWMAVVQWDLVHPYPHGSYWWWSWYYYYFYYYYYYYYQLSSALQKVSSTFKLFVLPLPAVQTLIPCDRFVRQTHIKQSSSLTGSNLTQYLRTSVAAWNGPPTPLSRSLRWGTIRVDNSMRTILSPGIHLSRI